MIDITKNYQTRSGIKVRIYAVDAGGVYPVHLGVWDDEDEEWATSARTADGSYYSGDRGESALDLIEVVPERWVNIYNDGTKYHLGSLVFTSEAEVQKCASTHSAVYVMSVKLPASEVS